MTICQLFSPRQIQEAVQKTARDIEAVFGGTEPVIALCLLNGAVWFTADLLRCLPPNFELQTVRISSYEGTDSTGKLKWHGALPECTGKRVLVIDDVLDTGLTMKGVCEQLLAKGAAQVVSVVAVSKIGRRMVNFEADFAAMKCEDLFLVGYGLDYNGKYRNLPFIGYME